MSFREQFGNLMTGAYKGDAPSFGDLMTGAYKGDTPSFGDLMTGGKKIDADDFLKLFTQRENEPFMVAHHMNPNVTDGGNVTAGGLGQARENQYKETGQPLGTGWGEPSGAELGEIMKKIKKEEGEMSKSIQFGVIPPPPPQPVREDIFMEIPVIPYEDPEYNPFQGQFVNGVPRTPRNSLIGP